jgi:hypothetical protein
LFQQTFRAFQAWRRAGLILSRHAADHVMSADGRTPRQLLQGDIIATIGG